MILDGMSKAGLKFVQKIWYLCGAAQHDAIVRFMREICAIPSMNSQIGPVGERIQAEMRKLGFDEVRFDEISNIIGVSAMGRPSPTSGTKQHVQIRYYSQLIQQTRRLTRS